MEMIVKHEAPSQQHQEPSDGNKLGFIGFDVQKLVKPILVLPIGFGIYKALTAKNKMEKTTGAAVATVSAIAFFTLSGKTDADNYTDTPNQKRNINEPLVQSFLSRFETGLAYYFCSDCCSLFKEYYELDNDNFIEIANRHKNKKGVTLKKDIQQTAYACLNDFGKKVIKRMNELNMP